MFNLFPRITAALLWMQDCFKRISKHKYGRAGIFVFVIVIGLIVSHPVYAEQNVLEKVVLFLANIALTIAVLLSKLVVVVIQILLPIMLYNNFSTSAVVSAGWAIVRDTVNMFFVIVLIAIAFGTIFGNSRFQWQQQITRLMIFAIVINFSKTLCGLMIDFGQVVMLTFANAIREVAAGNFVQLFGLGDTYSLSTSNKIFQDAATNSAAEGVKAFDWFASSLASVFMVVVVLGTMLMLLAILVYRVVMLWVMIVVSPLAWFIGGAGKIVKSNAYGDWWEKFICLVAIGPVLTFFLWLTLVVAGAGNVADGFNTGGSADGTAGGFLTKIFEMDRLISFVIAIAMLYAGFEAAQKSCSSVSQIGGLMKGGLTGNVGARALKGAAGLSARVGARGARVAGRVGARAARPVTREIGLATKGAAAKVIGGVVNKAGSGSLGRYAAKKLIPMKEKLEKAKMQEIGAAGESYKGLTDAGKVDQLRRFAESPAMTPQGKREQQALLMEAMESDKMQKELRASGHLDKLWKDSKGGFDGIAKTDKGFAEKLSAFKKKNADVTGSWDQIKNIDDVKGLSAFALANKDARGHLDGITSKVQIPGKPGEFYTASQAIEMGLVGGTDKRDAFMKGEGAIYEHMSDTELSRVPIASLAQNATSDLLDKKPNIVSQIIQSQDSTVRSTVANRIRDPKNGALASSLASGVGLDLKTGTVSDQKKFVEILKSNPSIVNYIPYNAFKKFSEREENVSMAGQVFSNPRVLKNIIRDVRTNPRSMSNQGMSSRVETILNKNANLEGASVEAKTASSDYKAHMDAIDEGYNSVGSMRRAQRSADKAEVQEVETEVVEKEVNKETEPTTSTTPIGESAEEAKFFGETFTPQPTETKETTSQSPPTPEPELGGTAAEEQFFGKTSQPTDKPKT